MRTINARLKAAASLTAAAVLVSCAGALDRAVDSPEIDGGTVVFRYLSPSARTVQVAGDWNNWSAGDAEAGEVLVGLMEREESGLWTIAVELPPGRHRYWFVVNEAGRVLDPANPRVTEDPWGGKASLCIVP